MESIRKGPTAGQDRDAASGGGRIVPAGRHRQLQGGGRVSSEERPWSKFLDRTLGWYQMSEPEPLDKERDSECLVVWYVWVKEHGLGELWLEDRRSTLSARERSTSVLKITKVMKADRLFQAAGKFLPR